MKSKFYEYIFFDKKAQVNAFSSYLKWMSKNKVMEVIPYSKRYGDREPIASVNIRESNKVKTEIPDTTPLVFVTETDDPVPGEQHVVKPSQLLPTILSYLARGQSVLYRPKKASMRTVKTVLKKSLEYQPEFICKNHKQQNPYRLDIKSDYPMFFSSRSNILPHLIAISKNMTDLQRNFNTSYLFVSRIRTLLL